MMNLRRLSLPTIDLTDFKNRINWVQVGKWFTIMLLIIAGVYHLAQ